MVQLRTQCVHGRNVEKVAARFLSSAHGPWPVQTADHLLLQAYLPRPATMVKVTVKLLKGGALNLELPESTTVSREPPAARPDALLASRFSLSISSPLTFGPDSHLTVSFPLGSSGSSPRRSRTSTTWT